MASLYYVFKFAERVVLVPLGREGNRVAHVFDRWYMMPVRSTALATD